MSHDLRAQRAWMTLALDNARQSPPKPTNFCVGAVLIQPSSYSVTTGYTLECEGNTHAEQSCFIKASQLLHCTEDTLGEYLDEETVLYTTMEPCSKRSVGNTPCVDRILSLKRKDGRQAIRRVYVGVAEPETFVGVNQGRRNLEEAGVEVVIVPGFEEEILKVATAGHVKETEEKMEGH